MIFNQPTQAVLAAEWAQQHPDLLVAMGSAQATSWYGAFQSVSFAPAGQQFFLADPLGNLMMFYGQQVTPKGILRDLQKLLKISQIG